MKKKYKIWAIVFSLLIAANVLFIFAQSMDSRELSSAKSTRVYEFLKPFLSLILGEENVSEHLIRKMAHFCEFGLLGVLTNHLVQLFSGRYRCGGVLFCLLIALGDETLQIFTGRGSMVQDVWLDFSGAMVGFFGVALLWCIAEKRKIDKK